MRGLTSFNQIKTDYNHNLKILRPLINLKKNLGSQKSIAISVTIQSLEKTLTDNDLEKINNLIIETVENKTGAKIRS